LPSSGIQGIVRLKRNATILVMRVLRLDNEEAPMNQPLWKEESEKRREESEKRHARMARLFKEDRLGFERERKRLFDEFFSSVEDEDLRQRLRSLQASFETKMKHAGSAHNRFVLAQTLFWDNFHNNWEPGILQFSESLKNLERTYSAFDDKQDS